MQLRNILAGNGVYIHTIDEDADLTAAARELTRHRIGALTMIGDDGGIQGILSERDISGALGTHGAAAAELPVSAVMTEKVITCRPDHEVAELFQVMADNNIRHLPVVEGERVVAMISIRDVSRALVQNFMTVVQDLKSLLVSLDEPVA